jgi:hypothetical protein
VKANDIYIIIIPPPSSLLLDFLWYVFVLWLLFFQLVIQTSLPKFEEMTGKY